jgi:hypothetical protein
MQKVQTLSNSNPICMNHSFNSMTSVHRIVTRENANLDGHTNTWITSIIRHDQDG